MSKRLALLVSLIVVPVVISACAELPQNSAPWRDIPLTDVATGQSFSISDFEGKVVVLETMMAWCDICARQEIEVARARDSLEDEVVFITLTVDPNEAEAIVLEHLNRHGFGWFFAVSPLELNSQLEAEFGTNFLNPASSPILILDREQEAHLLRYGHKSTEELIREISKYL